LAYIANEEIETLDRYPVYGLSVPSEF